MTPISPQPPCSQPSNQPGAPVRVAGKAQAAAVNAWENEGGHLPAPAGVAIIPTDIAPGAPTGRTAAEALAAGRAKFLADFADGRVGQYHNTFQHRARVLRQAGDSLASQ